MRRVAERGAARQRWAAVFACPGTPREQRRAGRGREGDTDTDTRQPYHQPPLGRTINIPYGQSSAKLPVTWSLGHLVTWSLGYFSHMVTR